MSKSSNYRVLEIYLRMSKGETVTYEQMIEEYDIKRSTFYRDLRGIRETIADIIGVEVNVVRKGDHYSLSLATTPQNSHLYILGKLLIGSRAFNSKEMQEILVSLSNASSVHGRAFLRQSIIDEVRNYKSITDARDRIGTLFQIETAIQKKHQLLLNLDISTEQKEYQIYPVEVFFDNYYFYLLGIYNGKYKIFKINDIKEFKELPKSTNTDIDPSSIKMKYQFVFPNANNLESKQDEIKLKVEWTGDLNYLTDFFPDAKISKISNEEVYICDLTTINSDGLKVWLLMNSEYIKILEPQWIVEELAMIYIKSLKKYKKWK